MIEQYNAQRRRIRAEYGEMPGLSLTEEQVTRMWHMTESSAHAVLQDLVRSGFLCCTWKGTYVRGDSLSR